MITIEQLLESVDLDFEPRWVTKDECRTIVVWDKEPYPDKCEWFTKEQNYNLISIGKIKLSEFDGKDWTECIYEVPRKKTGDIKKLGRLNLSGTNMTMNQNAVDAVVNTLNQVIDAVNELKGAKNE